MADLRRPDEAFPRQRDELLRQCLEWFDANRHRLLAYARQQADSATDVELLLTRVMQDVSQVFSQGRVRPAALLAYALRSIHNAAVTLHRRNARRQSTEYRYGCEACQRAQQEAPFEPDDHMLQLLTALRQLPEEHSTIVTLKIWDELSFAQIAERLDLPKSTVSRRYLAALAALRKHMTQPKHETP